jgi:phosphatidylserine synthase
MNFAELGRGTQVLLLAGILFLIDSFLDWQQVSAFNVSVGATMWHGVGVVAGLLVVALLVWEIAQLAGVTRNLELPVSAAIISAALAVGTAAFAIIKFVVANEARHWPAWIGLILAIAIAIGGWLKYSEAPAPATAAPTTPA